MTAKANRLQGCLEAIAELERGGVPRNPPDDEDIESAQHFGMISTETGDFRLTDLGKRFLRILQGTMTGI